MSEVLLHESYEGRNSVPACMLPNQDPTTNRRKELLETFCSMLQGKAARAQNAKQDVLPQAGVLSFYCTAQHSQRPRLLPEMWFDNLWQLQICLALGSLFGGRWNRILRTRANCGLETVPGVQANCREDRGLRSHHVCIYGNEIDDKTLLTEKDAVAETNSVTPAGVTTIAADAALMLKMTRRWAVACLINSSLGNS